METNIKEGFDLPLILHISMINSLLNLYENFWKKDSNLIHRIKEILLHYFVSYKLSRHEPIRNFLVNNLNQLVESGKFDMNYCVKQFLFVYDTEANLNGFDLELLKSVIKRGKLNNDNSL